MDISFSATVYCVAARPGIAIIRFQHAIVVALALHESGWPVRSRNFSLPEPARRRLVGSRVERATHSLGMYIQETAQRNVTNRRRGV
jgi:hypothetical protein